MTCAHVVKGAVEIYVRVENEHGGYEVFSAKTMAIDKNIDIALIKLESGNYFYALVDLERKLSALGEEIAIYGYPFGSRMNDDVMNLNISFARGYVSSNQVIKGRNTTLVDISAKAGNSGSPIISLEHGNVIGLLSGSMLGGKDNREEINYMIPISYLDIFLDKE